MACWLGDEAVEEARRAFTDAGIADYETPGGGGARVRDA
jgi:acetyltransferase